MRHPRDEVHFQGLGRGGQTDSPRLRGPVVFKGYYKLPDATRETVSSEGWLKTGDMAEFNPQLMSFKIIDRRKNIFKLQQGEYMAPDRIENKYTKCNSSQRSSSAVTPSKTALWCWSRQPVGIAAIGEGKGNPGKPLAVMCKYLDKAVGLDSHERSW